MKSRHPIAQFISTGLLLSGLWGWAPAMTTGEATVPALNPVASIDLARYQGTWYQLALIPNRFQAQCVANTRATYALQEDGTVQVTNQCRTAATYLPAADLSRTQQSCVP